MNPSEEIDNLIAQHPQWCGASLADSDGVFNTELNGNQRRGIDFFEGDAVPEASVQGLVRAAIAHNEAKRKK